jgi:hypothetical protein
MQLELWYQREDKTVFVREYLRWRFGKQEHVCTHFRHPPRYGG